MTPRRVLIVAYYFPPIGGIGSIRLASFAAGLPEFGWNPTVIAPRSTSHAGGTELDPSARVVRSTSMEIARLARLVRRGRCPRTGTRGSTNRTSDSWSGLASYVYPDAQIGWYPGAIWTGRRLLGDQRFDAVFSSSYPVTAHLVGRTLSHRGGLPWIAEFRDPWSDRLGAAHPHHDRAAALERRLATSASRLIMTSPTWAQHYGELWGREIEVVPNGHDGEIPSRPRPNRPTITYTGMFYPGSQSLGVVWHAVQQLVEAGRLETPVLRFVGEVPAELRRELNDLGLGRFVEETGFVSHREAKALMASSSVLIASGYVATDAMAQGVVPAKLFEYLATSLPIVYVGDRRSDASGLLESQPGCYVVAHDDPEGALSSLDAALLARPPRRNVENLSRRNRTAQLARILDDAVGS